MPTYSVGRRRTIALLALTSVLLMTLDVQNNFLVNGMRRAFTLVFEPVQDSARVVTRPLENAWRSITEFDELQAELFRLQDRLDQQEGAFIAALATARDAQELLALNGIDNLADVSSITAQVIGDTASNFSQVIEINQGSDRGLRVGMAVVNAAGLVGKVTEVFPRRALVMLATDVAYAIPVQVINPPTQQETETDAATTTTTPPTTTTIAPAPAPATTIATSGGAGTIPTLPPTLAPDIEATTAPETTVGQSFDIVDFEDLPASETGAFRGRGSDRAPIVEFIDQNSRFGEIKVGALVITSGGAASLAPRGIVVGRVIKITERSGTSGAVLEVRLSARLTTLNFVRILLYQPVAGG
jgi:rod shape-determining protein MreC